MTRADFQLLTGELATWQQQELDKIKAAGLPPQQEQVRYRAGDSGWLLSQAHLNLNRITLLINEGGHDADDADDRCRGAHVTYALAGIVGMIGKGL